MEYLFHDRMAFRDWLEENQNQKEGIWLILGKPGGPVTLSANEALEEALCVGWIDGQIRRVDDATYIKYFSPRRSQSIWSKRNREFVDKLISQGLMKENGYHAIENAKSTGNWIPKLDVITTEHVEDFIQQLEPYAQASLNFSKMSYSIQKTYTGFYLSAKLDETKIKRLLQIVDRLERNLKPLE